MTPWHIKMLAAALALTVSGLLLRGGRRTLKWVAGVVLMTALAAGFGFLYSRTFSGHRLQLWTHGPFDMDCGNYTSFTTAPGLARIKPLDKANKHPLTAAAYCLLGGLSRKFSRNPVLPGTILVSLGLLVFGLWLNGRVPLVYALAGTLLLGSSFAVWFNGAVLEARAGIFLGAALLLVGIDLVHRHPGAGSAAGAAFLTIPLLGFCVPDLYLLPLVPAVLALKWKTLGWSRAVNLAVLYLAVVLALVLAGFHLISRANPLISLREFIKVSLFEAGKNKRCNASYLTGPNLAMTSRQCLFCSVAGLDQPPTPRPGKLGAVRGSLWLKPDLPDRYARSLTGRLFIILYCALLIVCGVLFMIRRIRGGHLMWVLLLWIVIDIIFFTYFNPWARSPSEVEVIIPIIALLILGTARIRSPGFLLLVAVLAALTFFHNLMVMTYLYKLYLL